MKAANRHALVLPYRGERTSLDCPGNRTCGGRQQIDPRSGGARSRFCLRRCCTAGEPTGREGDLKTVIPTHLPALLSMECEIFAGAGGGVVVPGTTFS